MADIKKGPKTVHVTPEDLKLLRGVAALLKQERWPETGRALDILVARLEKVQVIR